MLRALAVLTVVLSAGACSPMPPTPTPDAGVIVDAATHVQFSCFNTSHLKFTSPVGKADTNISAGAMLDFVLRETTGTLTIGSGGAYPCFLQLARHDSSWTVLPGSVCTDAQGLTASYTTGGITGLPEQVPGSADFLFKGTLGIGAAAQQVTGTGQLLLNCVKGLSSSPVVAKEIPVKFTGMVPVAGFGKLENATDATQLKLAPDDLRISRPDDSLIVVSAGAVFKINATTYATERLVAPRGSRPASQLPDATVTTADIAANGDLLLGLGDGFQNYLGWLHTTGTWELLKTLPAVQGHPLYRVRATPHGGIIWTNGQTISTLDASKFSPVGSPGFDNEVCPTNDLNDTTYLTEVYPHFCLTALEVGADDVIHIYGNKTEGSGTRMYLGGFATDGRLLEISTATISLFSGAVQVATSATTGDTITQYGCFVPDGSGRECANLPPAVPYPPFSPVAFGSRLDNKGQMGAFVVERPGKGSPLVMTSTGAVFGYAVHYPPLDFNSTAFGGLGGNEDALAVSFGLYKYTP